MYNMKLVNCQNCTNNIYVIPVKPMNSGMDNPYYCPLCGSNDVSVHDAESDDKLVLINEFASQLRE